MRQTLHFTREKLVAHPPPPFPFPCPPPSPFLAPPPPPSPPAPTPRARSELLTEGDLVTVCVDLLVERELSRLDDRHLLLGLVARALGDVLDLGAVVVLAAVVERVKCAREGGGERGARREERGQRAQGSARWWRRERQGSKHAQRRRRPCPRGPCQRRRGGHRASCGRTRARVSARRFWGARGTARRPPPFPEVVLTSFARCR